MTYTNHGHHISGTVLNENNRPEHVARCGGPNLCKKCTADAAEAMDSIHKGPLLPANENYQTKAIRLVTEYVVTHLDKTDPVVPFEVYVVWFSKTLRNWKALVSTTLSDGMYYEVTYNGEAEETYVDAYKKFQNIVIRDKLTPAEMKLVGRPREFDENPETD